MARKTREFTEDEKAIYRIGFLDGEKAREKKTRAAQIIEISGLKQSSLPSLLDDLIQYIRRDECKTSPLTRCNIKKILGEIIHRMGLPKDITDSIIERDS